MNNPSNDPQQFQFSEIAGELVETTIGSQTFFVLSCFKWQRNFSLCPDLSFLGIYT
jgi:hypothetical protein